MTDTAVNVFELFAKIGLDTKEYEEKLGKSESKFKSFGKALGNGLKTAAKVGTAAIGAASAGIVALTKQAVESYAEYEQLVGGVETLYGSAYETVEEYAKGVGLSLKDAERSFEDYQNRQQDVLNNAANAYKTAGMSANEYMNTVNGFAASLTSSLGEYEWQAANYADMIVTDMADNANKMGTSMEAIQNAYSGFAKQNYTMLDNLKLGYGGTKEEMERLLRDAEKYAGYIEGSLDVSNFADVADAIHIVQEQMGITGTTAKEAASTIQGSASMMKTSWENLITGFANPEADLDALFENFTSSVVTFGQNLIPTIEQILPNLTSGLVSLANTLLPEIPPIISTLLPSVISGAESLITGFVETLPTLIATLSQIISEQGVPLVIALVDGILTMLPTVAESALDIIMALAQGLTDATPDLLPTIVQLITDLALMLTSPDMLTQMLTVALNLILTVGTGLSNAVPQLVGAVTDVIIGIVTFLTKPDNLQKLISTAVELVITLASGLVSAIPELLTAVGELILSIVNNFKETDWSQIGKDLVAGFKRGIQSAWKNLKTWFTGLFGDLKQIAKDILGIESPSKEFKIIGKYVDEGLALGLKQNADMAFDAASNVAGGLISNFDANLEAPQLVGRVRGGSTSDAIALLNELVNMFSNGTAKTNISNTRDLRGVSYG